jgi:hypothetical protein
MRWSREDASESKGMRVLGCVNIIMSVEAKNDIKYNINQIQ